MQLEEVRGFLESNHRGVINTHQPGGAVQSSIVVTGVYDGTVAFVSVNGRSAKVRNLRDDPRCTVLAVTDDWSSYVTVEGRARLFDDNNTDVDELRLLLRDVFKTCGDGRHSDWEEYDRVMRRQEAVAVLVRPDRIYGLLR